MGQSWGRIALPPHLFTTRKIGKPEEENTSRKHGKKEPHLFSHCISFDHRGMQSLNDYKLLFFILRLQN